MAIKELKKGATKEEIDLVAKRFYGKARKGVPLKSLQGRWLSASAMMKKPAGAIDKVAAKTGTAMKTSVTKAKPGKSLWLQSKDKAIKELKKGATKEEIVLVAKRIYCAARRAKGEI